MKLHVMLGIILAMLVPLVSSGCPPAEKSPQPPPDPVEIEQEESAEEPESITETVEISTSGDEEIFAVVHDLPDNWPEYIPIAPGAQVTGWEVSDNGDPLVHIESMQSLDEIIDYYEGALLELAWIQKPSLRSSADSGSFRLFYERGGEGLNMLGTTENGLTSVSLFYLRGTGE